MTSAEEIGMTWYNSCSEADRKKWHAAANSAVPADAYRAFCVQSAQPAVEPVADLIEWDVLPEDASERNRFDRNLTLLHGGDARVAVTTALRLWAAAHSGRDFGLMCAIFANEVAKMRVAAPPADALGGEGRTELGSKGGAA